jgi:hypothetical protein
MVRVIFVWLLLLIASAAPAQAQEVVVTSEVEGKGTVGMPIKGSITITHDRAALVDPNSFMLGEEPFEVEHIKDVQVAPNSSLVISLYSFTLNPQETGLQVLPEISVNVGGTIYRSFASTYTVEEIKQTQATPAGTSIVLQIEPLIIGETTLYPGQRIQVGYRYIFNYSQDLSSEFVPLVEAKGFKKIGGKTSETKMSGDLVHLDVLQFIEAVEPGDFHFPSARIEGRAWRRGYLGQKDFAVNESFAESEAVTLTVLPFPKIGQPASFNGAIGEKLSFKTALLTSDEVAVGDKMTLELTIAGNGELATAPIPELCCQPGMSGFFRLSDLPPLEAVKGAMKTFKVDMRPLNNKITEIPALEFTYFNPKDKTYHTVKSEPIPVVVTGMDAPDAEEEGTADVQEPAEEETTKEEVPAVKAIEIIGNVELDESDLKNRPFGTPWVLLMVPFGLGALFLQEHMRRFLLRQRMVEKEKTAIEVFDEAIKAKPGSSRFYRLLHQAFFLRLYERGDISDPAIPTDHLPDEGACGDVKVFLKEIEAKRFSGKEGEIGSDVITRANVLFNELRSQS